MKNENFIKLLEDNKIEEVKNYIENLDNDMIHSVNFISGHTLLHDVIYYNGNISLCELLLNKMNEEWRIRPIFAVFGGDFCEDDTNKTALHLAVERGYFDVCELLLNKMSSLKLKISQILSKTSHGSTPLFLAKFYRDISSDSIKVENYNKIYKLMQDILCTKII